MAADTLTGRYDLYDVVGGGDYGTVFKALDRQTDTVVAIKVVAGHPSHTLNELEGEGYVIKKRNEMFSAYTHSIITCTDGDHDFDLSELGSFIEHVGILEGDDEEQYEDLDSDEEEDEDRNRISAFYFAMELVDSHLFELELTPEEALDALFETYMTLRLVESKGWPHQDLGPQNILHVETDEVRHYTVNGQVYIARSRYLPKIIDWSTHVGSHHPSEPRIGSRRLLYFMNIERTYPEGMDELFYDFMTKSSFEHSIFDALRTREVLEGDKVKYFLPVTI